MKAIPDHEATNTTNINTYALAESSPHHPPFAAPSKNQTKDKREK
jgi:hypothetical protein